MSRILLPKNETDTGTPETSPEWEYFDTEKLGSMPVNENLDKSWENFGKISEIIKEAWEELKHIKEDAEETKKKLRDAEQNLEETKERTNQATTFMMTVAGIIVIGFFLASIPIFLDYFNNNEQRFEKFITEASSVRTELRNNFYSKEDLKNLIDEHIANNKIINCIKYKGYFSIRCFNQ